MKRFQTMHLNTGLLPDMKNFELRMRRVCWTFSPPPQVSDPHMHQGTCVTYVPWCMSGSVISCFLWSRWWKRSRHSRRMHNPQFYVFGKRPMSSHNERFGLLCIVFTLSVFYGYIYIYICVCVCISCMLCESFITVSISISDLWLKFHFNYDKIGTLVSGILFYLKGFL